MTSGNEQRRKRRNDSFRRDEADEADNWLAGLRGSGPDPFSAPPPSFDEPPATPLAPPPPLAPLDDSPRRGPGGRPPLDATQIGGRRGGPADSPSGVFRRDDSPSGSFRRGPADDSPNGSFRRSPSDESPSGSFRRGPSDDSPSGSFRGAAASPGGRTGPPADPHVPTQAVEPRGGRRRARDEEPTTGTGRRAAEPRPSESYDHGPVLEPIIKPLADYTPPQASTEPPPLVPIFPSMRPESSPTSGATGTGRRARRSAEDRDDTTTRRRFDDSAAGRTTPGLPTAGALGDVPTTGTGRRSRGDFVPAPPTTDIPPARRNRDADETTGFRRDAAPRAFDDTSTGRRALDAGTGRRGLDDTSTGTGRRSLDDSARGPGDMATGRRGLDDTGTVRRGPDDVGSGRRGLDDTGSGRRGPDDTGTTRRDPDGAPTGRRGRGGPEEATGFRRDDTGTARRTRGGFESVGFDPAAPDTGIGRQRPPFDDPRTADPRTGDFRPGDPRTGDFRPGDPRLTGPRPGDFRPDDPRTADPRTLDPRAAGLRADPRTGDPRIGDLRPGDPRTGDFGTSDPRTADPVAGRRGGFYAGPPTDRRDDTGTSRRGRDGFEPVRDDTGSIRRGRAGPDRTGAGFETGPTRRPAADEAPPQRRALDDALPGRGGFEETGGGSSRRRGRSTGEYGADLTTGGTKRALREPLGGSTRPGKPKAAVIDPVRVEHRPHRWIAALSVIGVIVLLAACSLGTWFIFKDEKNGPDSARSSATAGPKKRDISSRQVDPAPLTEAEVFPQNNIVAVPNEPPYVILKTQASPDCKTAATDDLATLLAGAGCTEVVRATMKSPNEEYLITAGIFNLESEKSAETAFDGVKPIVDGQKGRFAGMSVGAGTGTDAIVRAPTQLGWNFRGHFIAYCVIARVDGKEFAADDPYPNQITYDIVETYLENGIIGGRAIIQPEATPAASLPPS